MTGKKTVRKNRSDGMCPICKVNARTHAYCASCHSMVSGQYRERNNPLIAQRRNIGKWSTQQKGPKKPPTDWREVLRKADEAKS